MAALKTLQALIFLGLLAASCLAQAPGPAPITLLPPVESPSSAITPTAESPSPVDSPLSPVASTPVTEPTPAPATPPSVLLPAKSPKTSPVASPLKPEGLAPGPSGPTPSPSPAPAPEAPEADSALTNKAFLVSTVIAGALYAVVLA